MKRIAYLAGILAIGALAGACSKTSEKSKLEVKLTDSPGPYTAVNVDIQGVEIKGSDSATVSLNVTPQVVNLLDLANGKEMLIGTGELEPGKISQIRLILGSNNTIEVDGQTYPLSTPSAEQSGLKLQVDTTFEAGVEYSILLDFDAWHSIVQTGNGTYKLKPVLRTITTAISGSIKGMVSPAGTEATVVATGSGDLVPPATFSSPVNSDGNFILKGLPADQYTITIISTLPSSPKELPDKATVTVGQTTDLGTIDL